ncbi:Uncharacterised protein [Mycobacteroides abscessus subsp. massiliense]|nr:hypothetical protein PROPHIGD02-2_43 [Mycobacterium phage prophiGD02-2]QST87313.1 hypothetical protein PROPHIGD90-1_43 [Mycobacterium phage prophiGD90-1]CPR39056.1 Uncharacterised protein [Mycobacteroides abscessus]SIM65696.1 Uncharacterised protein [Mycobacteroides abscessus subsp. abscessus]SKD23890.1 Uncharacterised protein [Mycobacteroides abscessus subsp. massiliense]
MSDPSIEAVNRVIGADALLLPEKHRRELVAAAREMAKSVQELHRRVGGLRATVCEACQVYWPCETAKRVYPSEELGL